MDCQFGKKRMPSSNKEWHNPDEMLPPIILYTYEKL